MPKSVMWIGFLAFSLVLSDSLISYFIRNATGYPVPVNAVLPFLLMAMIFKGGFGVIRLPIAYWFFLVFGFVGFLIGIIMIPEVNVRRVLPLSSAVTTFFIGYASVRWATTEKAHVRILLLVCSLYILVCILAVTKVNPGLFPVIYAQWPDGIVVQLRHEVTVDQNFQVFYLFSQLVLGWVLAKEEFGVYAIAIAFSSIVMMLRNGGTEQVLIKKGDSMMSAMELIDNGSVDMVINILREYDQYGRPDGYLIRRRAIDANVPLIRGLQLTWAVIEALRWKKPEILNITAWNDYLACRSC